jgi:iron(III) transport system substrate-binding protein
MIAWHKDFEREMGIEVKAVFDTEETKSTGVMNRLIAEKHNPQADVYWANEPIRAEMLKQRGIATPYQSR